jgi:hypothetical protein
VDSAERVQHGRVTQGRGRSSRRIRRAEERSVYQFRHSRMSIHRLQRGTVEGCPLHGVGGLR